MNSNDLAQYIETMDGTLKPWLLVQLRIKMLQERRGDLSTDEYAAEIGISYLV